MSVNGDVANFAADEEDFYHVLGMDFIYACSRYMFLTKLSPCFPAGVTRDASEKQINIAFKKLALKYHPDRNVDDEYAAVKFKAVNDAFHVLNDPGKRRAYDQRYDKTSPSTSTDVTLSSGSDVATTEGNSLTGIGRVFGAVISRFGINTQISQDIIATAQAICRNGGIEGGGPPLDQRVSDLPWGWAAEAKVDRQTAAYYRLTADPQHTEIGFIIHGRSVSKGKFKMIMFDKDGTVMHQVDSSKDKDANYTQATFFFTNFDTYHLGEATTVAAPPQPSPLLAAAEKDKSFPPVLSRLETFTHSSRKLASGQYLLCVYGDNLFGKTAFSIIAVPAKMDSPEVRGLEELDEILLESKRSLAHLKTEYILAKAAYERVLEKISATEDKLDGDVSRREKFYTGFIDASIREFSPMSTDFESINQQQQQQQVSGSIPIPLVGSAHGSTNPVQFSSSPPTASSLSGAVSLLGAVGKSVSATGLGNSSSHANTQHSHKQQSTTTGSTVSSGAVAGDDVHAGDRDSTGAAGGGSSGVLGYLTTNTISVASNAASVTTNAAQTATAAGGWIARRFSCKFCRSAVHCPVNVIRHPPRPSLMCVTVFPVLYSGYSIHCQDPCIRTRSTCGRIGGVQ